MVTLYTLNCFGERQIWFLNFFLWFVSPNRCQAIIWTNTGLLSIGPLGTNFSEILIKIENFSFKEIASKISSAKWWPFCPRGDDHIYPQGGPNLAFSQGQYHSCWWPGDVRSQVISRHGIDLIFPEYSVALTHWGRDKMTAISQTTSLNAFSWMKMYEFRLRFHWSLFLSVQLTIF